MPSNQPKAVAPAEAPKTEKAVKWGAKNHFEEFRMRYSDWMLMGAPDLDEEGAAGAVPADTVWDHANGWIVRLSALPLNEAQVADFVSRDPKLTLIEV